MMGTTPRATEFVLSGSQTLLGQQELILQPDSTFFIPSVLIGHDSTEMIHLMSKLSKGLQRVISRRGVVLGKHGEGEVSRRESEEASG